MLGQVLSRRLHEQRIFTDELIDQLGEGVLAVERLGTIAYVNAEAVRLLGLASGDVQGRPVAEVLGRDDLRPVLAMVRQELCPAMQRMWRGVCLIRSKCKPKKNYSGPRKIMPQPCKRSFENSPSEIKRVVGGHAPQQVTCRTLGG